MKTVFSAVIMLALLIPSIALAASVPNYIGYVNDYANILDNKAQLSSLLTELQSNTTIEFAVVTLSSLPQDETMESYSHKIFNTWGIGKKGQDNGLLFVMVANGTPGSKMRLEIGYGLEGYMTDSQAGRILDDAIPYYDNGSYSQAAYIVVSESQNLLQSTYEQTPAQQQDNTVLIAVATLLPIIIIFIFIIAAVRTSRTKCPRCGSTDVKCVEENCTCNNCGKKFKKKKNMFVPVFVGAGGYGGGWSGGGGGFGGGASGGGGAGR